MIVKDKRTPPPEAGGLERHFGYKEFETMIRAGTLRAGMDIILFEGSRNNGNLRGSEQEVTWYRMVYQIVDEHTLKKREMQYEPKKTLRGSNWYAHL